MTTTKEETEKRIQTEFESIVEKNQNMELTPEQLKEHKIAYVKKHNVEPTESELKQWAIERESFIEYFSKSRFSETHKLSEL